MILARSHFLVRRTLQRNGWRIGHLLIAMSLIGIAVLVTSDAWDDLLHIAARDEESSQIWLVPIAVVWLAWLAVSAFQWIVRPLMARMVSSTNPDSLSVSV